MVSSLSILGVRVAGTSRLEIDFSTGQTIALELPPELGRDADHGFVDGLIRVLQAVLALGSNDPQSIIDGIRNSPIRSFDGKTALEMIAAGRTADVVDYVGSISAGYVG